MDMSLWHFTEYADEFTDDGYILIDDDGHANWRRWGDQDLTFTADDALFGELPASDVYVQCLADDSVQTRFDCMRQFVDEPAPLVCDEGWSNG